MNCGYVHSRTQQIRRATKKQPMPILMAVTIATPLIDTVIPFRFLAKGNILIPTLSLFLYLHRIY